MQEPVIQGRSQPSLGRIEQRQRGESPVRKMTASQIFRESALKEGIPPQEADKRLAQLSAVIQKGMCRPIQAGNTLFILFPTGPGEVEFHTATIERPDVLISRFKTLAVAAQKLGVKKARTFFTDPSFLRIAQMTEYPIKIEQSSQKIGNEMRPAYKLEVDL